MFEITKGYKQGRAVLYYDILNQIEGNTEKRVHKDRIVELCKQGEIVNATVQWWQGKAIVRVKSNNLPVEKIESTSNEKKVDSKRPSDTKEVELDIDISSKAKVIGKLNSKKAYKQNIAYTGYDYKILSDDKHVYLGNLETINDMFNKIAKDFNIKHVDVYKKEFAKKVDLNRPLKSLLSNNVALMQMSISTYLMNMAHLEISETYEKYKVRV